MTDSKEARLKLEDLKEQIRKVELNQSDVVMCPYCGGVNSELTDGDNCCKTFVMAVAAIYQAWCVDRLRETADAIAQQVN